MLMHGPWKPSVNESRPAAIEMVPPVAAYTLEPLADIAWKSALVTPKKTPVQATPMKTVETTPTSLLQRELQLSVPEMERLSRRNMVRMSEPLDTVRVSSWCAECGHHWFAICAYECAQCWSGPLCQACRRTSHSHHM